MTTRSEQELIKLCQQGDKAAFEQLYRRYASDVYAMAMRMTSSCDAAEEVTQDVFISVYKNIQTFQFQSAFTTWLYRIAHRRSADFFRRTRKHRENTVSATNKNETSLLDQLSDDAPDPNEKAQLNERDQLIEQAIASLKAEQALILQLRYLKHLSYEEISTVMECRLGTVKSRLNRAHQSLQEALRKLDYF